MSLAESLVRQAREWGRAGDMRRSRECYKHALIQDPKHYEAVHFLGVLTVECSESFEEALRWINRSIKLARNSPLFLTNKSIVLQRQYRFDEARECLDTALKINPNFELALLNFGHVEKELKVFFSATHFYEKVVSLAPADIAAYEHLSFCYPYPEGLYRRCWVLERACLIDPRNPDVHFGLGAYCLLAGRFAEGWDYFESRWDASHVRDNTRYSKPLNLPRPRFDASYHKGRVFIWSEQGIGDELMFASLVGDFVDRFGIDVILQVDPRLHSLLSRSMPKWLAIPRGSLPDPKTYESQMPAGDLPRLLRRSIESFGCGSSGFLVADERRKSAMHASLAKMGRPVVGISWHSSNGESRCVQLDKLISVVRSFNVSVVNLQYGDHTSEIRAVEEHLGRPPFDFSELDCQNDIEGLSALISCCDLVVSIGNSTVHFSGGLGIKTIALLPHFPGWRWLSQGDQSLWYQSVRVLRQHHPGDWSSVLRSLEGELSTRFSRV